MAVWEVSKNHSLDRGTPVARRPLLWLNLICLDAPLIAISWKWLFSREFGVSISGPATLALFLTSWLIYAADRFADAISLQPSDPKSRRHDFCLRHRRIWFAGILVIALVDGCVVLARLEPELLRAGIILGALAAAYLVINYWFNTMWQTLPAKECAIGFMFAAGTLFTPASRVSSLTATFVLTGFLFALLCALNCICIAVWERDLDRAQGKHSIATQWSGASRLAQIAPFLLSILCGVLAFFFPGNRPLLLCIAVSGLFLGALHFWSIARDERTALADLVLLAPCVLLLANLV